MAIEAPLSKYKKNDFRIAIAVCIGLAVWCVYDGYFNEQWIEEHTKADGSPNSYLVFNRNAPPYLIGAAVIFGAYLFGIRKRKIVAGESELNINNKEKIPYDSIQKIDKTRFESKGLFIITYKDKTGSEVNVKLVTGATII
jgi:hypothetical protein